MSFALEIYQDKLAINTTEERQTHDSFGTLVRSVINILNLAWRQVGCISHGQEKRCAHGKFQNEFKSTIKRFTMLHLYDWVQPKFTFVDNFPSKVHPH